MIEDKFMHTATLKNPTTKKLPILLLLVIGTILSIQIGSAIALEETTFLLVIVFIVTAIVALANAQLGIILVILLTFFQDWLIFSMRLLPENFALLSEGLILVLTLKVIPKLIIDRSWKKAPIDFLMLLLFLITLMSGIMNNMTFLEIVLGMRIYFRYIMFYYIIINLDFTEDFLNKLVMVFVYVAVISIPVLFINAFIWGFGDYAGNGIGLKSSASMLFNVTIIILLVTWMIKKQMTLKWLVIVGGLMLVWVFGSVVAAFFYLPLIFMFVSRRLTNVRYLFILSIIFLMYFLAVTYYPKLLLNDYLPRFVYSPSTAFNYIKGTPQHGGDYGEAGLRRLPAIVFANNLVNKNLYHLSFGLGPGVTTPTGSALSMTHTVYRHYERENLSGQQLPQFIAEIGYVGLSIIFLIFFKLVRINNKLLNFNPDDFWIGVGIAFEAAIFMFIAMMPYKATWTAHVTGAFFWSLAALITKKWLLINQAMPAKFKEA
jgi:hypothetical protein